MKKRFLLFLAVVSILVCISTFAFALEVSHITGYNPTATVHEPATMFLLCSGLLSFAFFERKKRNI